MPFLFIIVLEVKKKRKRKKIFLKTSNKEIKAIQIRNEEIKLFLFTYGMIVYVENLKDSIKTIKAPRTNK